MNQMVSILMPVYNVAQYVEEAMESILNQTYRDFELIVLDDCSPDGSAEIIDRCEDARIVRYRGERNVGLANILNVGMGMAKGKYIVRMDSDDISLPNRLEVQVNYMEVHPEIDLCSCGMQLFGDKEGVWVRDTDVEEVKITALFYSPILHASAVWRRESFEKYGLRFNQEMVPAEDYDMWVRALCEGLKLVNIGDVLYKYRIRGGSSMGNIQKSIERSGMVVRNYLNALFPNLDQSVVDIIAKKQGDTIAELYHLRDAFGALERVNRAQKIPFFDMQRLHIRLQRYYQNKLYEGMVAKRIPKRVGLLYQLRMKQVIKLIIK